MRDCRKEVCSVAPAGLAILSLLFSLPLNAQTNRDAGQLMREIEKTPGVQSRPSAPLVPVQPQDDEAPLPREEGETVFVKGFRVMAESFPESELVELLADFVDKDLGLAELQEATRRISEFYRSKDILAHAYLPPQTVRDGIIEIVVVEGRLGKIRIDESQQARINPDLAVGSVLARLGGASVHPSEIDEAVAVLSEVPGISASSAMTAGANPNETDALLILQDAPILSGGFTLDNARSPTTGQSRQMITMASSGALGQGERLSILGLNSFGSKYGKVALRAPLGYSGLSAEINATRLDTSMAFVAIKAAREFSQQDHGTRECGSSYPLLPLV